MGTFVKKIKGSLGKNTLWTTLPRREGLKAPQPLPLRDPTWSLENITSPILLVRTRRWYRAFTRGSHVDQSKESRWKSSLSFIPRRDTARHNMTCRRKNSICRGHVTGCNFSLLPTSFPGSFIARPEPGNEVALLLVTQRWRQHCETSYSGGGAKSVLKLQARRVQIPRLAVVARFFIRGSNSNGFPFWTNLSPFYGRNSLSRTFDIRASDSGDWPTSLYASTNKLSMRVAMLRFATVSSQCREK